MRLILFFFLSVFCDWIEEVGEVARFLVRYGATKREVALGIREMLENQNWTATANFLVLVFSASRYFVESVFGDD